MSPNPDKQIIVDAAIEIFKARCAYHGVLFNSVDVLKARVLFESILDAAQSVIVDFFEYVRTVTNTLAALERRIAELEAKTHSLI